MMNNMDWINNSNLQKINPQKLLLLNQLLGQANFKSKEELIPFFIAASSKASDMGMTYTEDETNLIINVLKENMSEEEKTKIETIRNLAKMITKKK